MAGAPTTNDEYELLESRLKTLLPEKYQDSYKDVQPQSMGSAGLKYAPDGRVAWDEIWGSFCDLAMAGGPPHRGTLLQPATPSDIKQNRQQYKAVVDELCRAVQMVTGLATMPSPVPGWIQVDCPSAGMAGWLVRAITMENVSVHVDGMSLYLPAGPRFRLEKEVKNVVVSIAKTCHYWLGHTSVAQHRAIAALFNVMHGESPLLQPPFSSSNTRTATFETLRDKIAEDVLTQTGLHATGRNDHGWLGIDCLSVPSAIWMMRVMVASNVLARREGNLLCVPINPSTDRRGQIVTGCVARAYRIACAQNVLSPITAPPQKTTCISAVAS